ncbi:hypothetical protein ACFVW2_00895 [Streptomyces sp. NPDC058171]
MGLNLRAGLTAGLATAVAVLLAPISAVGAAAEGARSAVLRRADRERDLAAPPPPGGGAASSWSRRLRALRPWGRARGSGARCAAASVRRASPTAFRWPPGTTALPHSFARRLRGGGARNRPPRRTG